MFFFFCIVIVIIVIIYFLACVCYCWWLNAITFFFFFLIGLEFSLLYDAGLFYLRVIIFFLLSYCTAHLNMNHSLD